MEERIRRLDGELRRMETENRRMDAIEDVENRENEEELDDIEEEESQYFEEETTDEKDIVDFEKKLKAEAKKTLSNFNAGSIEMNDDTYLEIIGNLNLGQHKIFDDFVERINSNCDPFYLYIGGDAGTGKSYL